MKKTISFIFTILLLFVSMSSYASTSEDRIDDAILSYNVIGNSFKIEELSTDNMVRIDDSVWFTFPGYDVIILFDNEDIKAASIRLRDKTYSSDFLINCMVLITYLGDYFEYESYGTMLYQYGEIIAGKAETMSGYCNDDYFEITPGNEDYICQFLYSNTDRKESL